MHSHPLRFLLLSVWAASLCFFSRAESLEQGAPSAKKSNVAFLGVAFSEVEVALRRHLNLPDGVGLLVVQVEAGSPAEAAGLRPYDVLHKVGDQLAINNEQVSVLIQMHKAGDKLELTLIREGKASTISATLAEKELSEPQAFKRVWTFRNYNSEFLPKPDMEAVNRFWHYEAAKKPQGRTLFRFKDEQGELVCTNSDEGQVQLQIKNKQGEEVYSGPLLREDSLVLPETLRGKMKQARELYDEAVKTGGDSPIRQQP